MINLLKKSSYLKSLWKNGRGTTEQIDIYPPTATLQQNDFLWRMSSAFVKATDTFSQFPGCDRVLLVWQGNGLLLNTQPLLPDHPLFFRGEEEINCELINESEVIDLGIIYKRDQVKVDVELLSIEKFKTKEMNVEAVHYFFLAKGASAQLNDYQMSQGDTIKVEEKESIKLQASNEDLLFYHFSINKFL